MNGFIAFGPTPVGRGAASCRPPRSSPLGRRSGRVPALPCPPPKSSDYTPLSSGHAAPSALVARRLASAAASFSLRVVQIASARPTGASGPGGRSSGHWHCRRVGFGALSRVTREQVSFPCTSRRPARTGKLSNSLATLKIGGVGVDPARSVANLPPSGTWRGRNERFAVSRYSHRTH